MALLDPSRFAAGGLAQKALQVIAPKKVSTPKGVTTTYNAASPQNVLTVPQYRDHLSDLFDTRQASDARDLIKLLMVQDPDASAATNAFLTTANTDIISVVKDANGAIDRPGLQTLNQLLLSLTTRYDYSKGFEHRLSLRSLAESMRYMLLLRGMLAAEAVITKEGVFNEIRQIDPKTLEWYEKQNGIRTPIQKVSGADDIDLNIPTFFIAYFRQDPTSLYPVSPFVSAINTIAARQQVINDLYRIMQVTGYPRMEITVVEEILAKNAPPIVKADPAQLRTYVEQQLASISNTVATLRPDQAFVHTDSIAPKMMNESKAGMTMNIEPIIKTLNAQNQAGLRAVSTILGRGEAGVNTASVEARIFSMTAQELNEPIADILSRVLTLVLRMTGSQSYVEVRFRPVELRPDLELEPQRVLKSDRLKKDLSLGIIDDDEYHLEMYGRIRPDSAPVPSGTGFMEKQTNGSGTGADTVTPNSDPLGRSVSSGKSTAPKDNKVSKKK